MKRTLNSNLFRIVSVAMYGTQLDPDSMFDSYMIESDKDDGYIHFGIDYFWDNFQSQKYLQFQPQHPKARRGQRPLRGHDGPHRRG